MALPKNPTQLEVVKEVNDKANDSAVVHKTGNETIQGNKTFISNIDVKNPDDEMGSVPAEDRETTITFKDKNGNQEGQFYFCHDTNDLTQLALILNGSQNGIACVFLEKPANGDWCYYPSSNNSMIFGKDNGTAGGVTKQWKRVYSQEIYQNGKRVANAEDLPKKTSDLNNDSDFITSSYHDSTKANLSGATFTGQVKFNTTSKTYNNGNIIGSKQADAGTVPNLVDELRFTNGQMGSVNISTAYTLNNITVGSGWYNYIYIPHRGGGNSGQADGDNVSYGTLILKGMTMNSPIYSIRVTSGSIAALDSTHTFTLSGTTLTIS